MLETIAYLLEIQKKLKPLEVNEEYQKAVKKFPSNLPLAFAYNEFRIAHLEELPTNRPHILVGGAISRPYPNLHWMHLCQIADVVCITGQKSPYPLHGVIPSLPTDLFSDILKRLPPGFKPDFYWDNQVEHQHLIPVGLEQAPFPTVASLCHIFLHKSIEHICELFDYILPLSSFHAKILRKQYGSKILEMPFGLNWAAPSAIEPQWKKSIDLCVTFLPHPSPAYAGKRDLVFELARRFKESYGDRYSIEFASGLDHSAYVKLLQESRITLNVTGVHGPYNYRTNEAMRAGSMIFQYDWEGDFFENTFSDLFVDGVHGAGFTAATFEKKLLYYLENPKLTEKIARKAFRFLNNNYSYKKLLKPLLQAIQPRPRLLSKYEGFHHVSQIYYNQNNELAPLIDYETLFAMDRPDWMKRNNLMILSLDLPENSLGRTSLITENFDTLYENALAACPPPFAWIVKWNRLLLLLQMERASLKDLEEMALLLEKLDPDPFDELTVMFKYFILSPRYPQYNPSTYAVDSIHPFTQLNIDLMKVANDPKKRAMLHRNYALEVVRSLIAGTAEDIV